MALAGHQAISRRPAISRHSLSVCLVQRPLNIFLADRYGHGVKPLRAMVAGSGPPASRAVARAKTIGFALADHTELWIQAAHRLRAQWGDDRGRPEAARDERACVESVLLGGPLQSVLVSP